MKKIYSLSLMCTMLACSNLVFANEVAINKPIKSVSNCKSLAADSNVIKIGTIYTGNIKGQKTHEYVLNVSKDTRVEIKVKEYNVLNKKNNLMITTNLANVDIESTDRQYGGVYTLDLVLKKGKNTIKILNDSASTDYKLTVTKVSGPRMPTVNKIGDTHENITGSTEVGNSIYIKIGSAPYLKAYTDRKGKFVLCTGKLKKGTKISVYAKDKNGNKSSVLNTECVDTTPPKVPTVNEVLSGGNTIYGKAEANSIVECKIKNGIEYSILAPVDKNGNYSFSLDEKNNTVYGKAKANSKCTLKYVSDPEKASISVTVISDKDGYYSFTMSEKKSKGASVITGKAKPGSVIEYATLSDKIETIIGYTDRNGDYSMKTKYGIIDINKLKRKSSIRVRAIDALGNEGEYTKVVVKNYVAPPKVKNFSNLSTNIYGSVSKGCSVYAKIGKKTYNGSVDANGKFSIKIPKQAYKTVVKVYTKDKQGDISSCVSKIVLSAPKTPTISKLTVKSTKIKGASSKDSTIIVTAGKNVYEGKTNSDGKFSIKIPKQKKGTKVVVQAKSNKTGLKSSKASVTVK